MKKSENMCKYKAVVFDLDGTLLDTSAGIIKSVDYTIKKMGLSDLSPIRKRSFIGPPIQNSFRETYSLDDEATALAAGIFRKQYSEVDLFEAQPYEGILDLLDLLRRNQIKIGVATYKREDYALKILEHFGISDYCDSMRGSDFEGKYTKQVIIELCIDDLNVSKQEVLMVGDTENDRIGAERAGVDFLGVGYGFGYTLAQGVNLSLFADKVSDIKVLLGL